MLRTITLAAAVVDTPATTNGSPALSHLIGLSMLIVEQEGGRWSFKLHAQMADQSEASLLEWAADRMAWPATLIGWKIADDLFTPLLDAARHVEPPIAHHFTMRLARLVSQPCVDLAIDHGGAGAPAFAVAAQEAGLNLAVPDAQARFSAWAFGELEPIQAELEAEAIALWRFWLTSAGDPEAEAATADWLSRR